jgi:hypothetical protein
MPTRLPTPTLRFSGHVSEQRSEHPTRGLIVQKLIKPYSIHRFLDTKNRKSVVCVFFVDKDSNRCNYSRNEDILINSSHLSHPHRMCSKLGNEELGRWQEQEAREGCIRSLTQASRGDKKVPRSTHDTDRNHDAA